MAGGEVERPVGIRVDHREKTQQSFLDTLADPAAEGAFQRTRVGRHLTRDSCYQIVAKGRELQPQGIGKVRRKLSSWNSLHGSDSTPDGPVGRQVIPRHVESRR